MTLEDLDGLPSFALLGPGFRGPGFTLLEGLDAGCGAATRLVFAAYEDDGRRPRVLGARRVLPFALGDAPAPGPLRPLLRAEGHGRKIGRIRESIARGDVYQVCLCARAELRPRSGASLLRRMIRRGTPRFAAWARLPDGTEFVSASPEMFFETRGAAVRSQPMKGTAPAGGEAALRASAKDRAELAMITDLVRNDLTPVCRPGSVRVACARRLLRLPYAVQAVSEVRGLLRPGAGPLDALAALHPGGSVTGAPKSTALEAIRGLEDGPRGAYCGALGLWSGPRATFSLLIRTAQRTRRGWAYGVGGGIVWDSSPEGELRELRVKLGAL